MKFLKTFFGQVLRKNDIDFESQSVRDINVQAHIDFSDAKGGVINGLDVYRSIDGLSIYITPGVFYTKGAFNQRNSHGGGERGQIYTQQTISNLPATAPFGLAPSYLAVYVKTTSTNYNPDPTQSQAVVSSRNIQTGENVPVREYTAAVVSISNPISLDQLGGINGIVLAVIQVDYVGTSRQSSNGTVQTIDMSYKNGYIIGGSVDLLNNRLIDTGVPDSFITSRMIGSGSVTTGKFADSSITSAKIAVWDGSSTSATVGSGVATEHLKDQAVTGPKMNITGSMSGFSSINYIGNSSFEKDPLILSDWSIYNPSSLGTAVATSSYSYFGTNGALLRGSLNPGPPATAQPIGISQIINLTGNQVNNRDICAFFYLKTSADFPLSIAGTNGIHGTIEFMSANATIDAPVTFASYSGVATDWIKLQTTTPLRYSGTSQIDGLRLSISGSFVNVDAYVDGIFLGLTNLIPSWAPSAADSALGDTFNISNINTLNLNATNASIINSTTNYLTTSHIDPLTSGVSTIGTSSLPFAKVYTNSLIIGGTPLNLGQSMQVFSSISTGFNVPLGVTAITVELVGAGGAGAGSGGAGGGAGEYIKTSIPVVGGELLEIAAGVGGLAGATSNGLVGGDSYIIRNSNGVRLINAAGGGGGFTGSVVGPGGGPGFSVVGPTIRIQGLPGRVNRGGDCRVSFFGGDGGSSIVGYNATGNGAGGGSNGTTGGAGANGLIIITW